MGEDIVASGFAEAGLDEAAEEVTEVVSDEDALIFGTWMIEGDEGGVLIVDEVAYGLELTRRRRALHYRSMRYSSCILGKWELTVRPDELKTSRTSLAPGPSLATTLCCCWRRCRCRRMTGVGPGRTGAPSSVASKNAGYEVHLTHRLTGTSGSIMLFWEAETKLEMGLFCGCI